MLWTLVIISMILQTTKNACPNVCSCIHQSIDCSSRQLTTIPSDLTNEVVNVGILGNPFQPDEAATITSLNLANNQLEELPTSLLADSFPHLQSLDLSNNKILEVSNIQSVVLNKQLLYFNISSNPIKNLGLNTDTVLYSQSISHLDISDCAINSITNPETFMYIMNLTYLDLSGNPLVVIDHLVSSTLNHLDLSCCLLGLTDKGIREDTFVNLPNLQFLNLSKNSHLTRFSTFSKPLSTSLTYLEASYCALERVDLRYFPNLQHASLKGNVIKILYNNILSNNTHLHTLDFSENSISHVEQNAFSGGYSLKKLDMSMNLLFNLPWNIFSQIPELRVLNISRNLFTSLDAISAPSLTNLDASKCDILNIGSLFMEKSQELRFLNLSHNSIEKLPKRLTSQKLKALDLSYCRISDLQDETFQGLQSLVSLNLMGNRLTNPVKESSFTNLIHMKELNLLNNPWHCDCNDSEFVKLWEYISSYSRKKDSYLEHLICHSPKEVKGLSWEKSCFQNLTRNGKAASKNRAWFSFLVPFLTLCCLLTILMVIRQAYTSHGTELQQRNSARSSSNSENTEFSPRVPAHFFDSDLERGIQLSTNESTQRSPIRELSKLPSYEEALLLPKIMNREDLENVIKQYEENGKFERPSSYIPLLSATQVDSDQYNEDSIDNPSTSGS